MTIWLADVVAGEERGWRKHPRLSLAVAVALLIAGVVLIVFDISRPAGNIFLLGFLVEVGIWLTRVRGRPESKGAKTIVRRAMWKELPLFWWGMLVVCTMFAVAALTVFWTRDSYSSLAFGIFLILLVTANVAVRVIDHFRPGAFQQ